jgi:hypothetical protein
MNTEIKIVKIVAGSDDLYVEIKVTGQRMMQYGMVEKRCYF